MTFYNLRTNLTQPDLPFTITKFTSDLEVEASYSVGTTLCECPAGHRPTCRHRQMLVQLRPRVDTAWFWNFEAKAWEDPTGEAQEAEHNSPIAEDVIEEDIAPQAVDQAPPLCACGVEGCPNNKGDLCDMSSQRGDSPMLNSALPPQTKPSTESVSGFRRRI